MMSKLVHSGMEMRSSSSVTAGYFDFLMGMRRLETSLVSRPPLLPLVVTLVLKMNVFHCSPGVGVHDVIVTS